MEEIINFFRNNYTWIFSGIGVSILILIFSRRGGKSLRQSIRKNSTGIQVGENLTINVRKPNSKPENEELGDDETNNKK